MVDRENLDWVMDSLITMNRWGGIIRKLLLPLLFTAIALATMAMIL